MASVEEKRVNLSSDFCLYEKQYGDFVISSRKKPLFWIYYN